MNPTTSCVLDNAFRFLIQPVFIAHRLLVEWFLPNRTNCLPPVLNSSFPCSAFLSTLQSLTELHPSPSSSFHFHLLSLSLRSLLNSFLLLFYPVLSASNPCFPFCFFLLCSFHVVVPFSTHFVLSIARTFTYAKFFILIYSSLIFDIFYVCLSFVFRTTNDTRT